MGQLHINLFETYGLSCTCVLVKSFFFYSVASCRSRSLYGRIEQLLAWANANSTWADVELKCKTQRGAPKTDIACMSTKIKKREICKHHATKIHTQIQ